MKVVMIVISKILFLIAFFYAEFGLAVVVYYVSQYIFGFDSWDILYIAPVLGFNFVWLNTLFVVMLLICFLRGRLMNEDTGEEKYGGS